MDGNNVIQAGVGTVDTAAAAGCMADLIVDRQPSQLVAVRRTEWSTTVATTGAITDNRPGELAEWDEVALVEQLWSLQSQ